MTSINTHLLSIKRDYTLDRPSINAIDQCLSFADRYSEHFGSGLTFAATFDLMVSAAYYKSISNRGWTYCSIAPETMFYAYTNTCPRCIGQNKFVYAKANKPESGKIGQITTEILCLFYQYIFTRNGHQIEVFKAQEPIDVIIRDIKNEIYLIAEVKAAPLLTVPIATRCERITEIDEGELVFSKHAMIDNPTVRNSRMSLYLPAYGNTREAFYPIDIDWSKESCFFDAILSLIKKHPSFFDSYLNFWIVAFNAYKNKTKDISLYWLTNACGIPSPMPKDWPKHKGGGYESISDSKTSAGMDRTDDIKKGIYQVLKLGSEYKTRYPNVKTAILSNLPALRHYEEYLLKIKDIVWAITDKTEVKKWKDLPPDTPVYNLFDGIISLTDSEARDAWIQNLLSKND